MERAKMHVTESELEVSSLVGIKQLAQSCFSLECYVCGDQRNKRFSCLRIHNSLRIVIIR
jgi:hypothetical protein